MLAEIFQETDVNESIIVVWAAMLSFRKTVYCGDETVLFLFVLVSMTCCERMLLLY
jgi:hypothetical protein